MPIKEVGRMKGKEQEIKGRAETKLLEPDEYSEDRKRAMQELYGENWRECLAKQRKRK